MKRTILSLALLPFIPTSLFAQQPDCRHRTIPVSVVDRNEGLVAGLTAEDFQGSFHGKPLKIVSAKLNVSPRRIVILLDISASMSERNGSNKPAVSFFLAKDALLSTRRFNEVALFTFAERVRSRTGLTRNRQEAIALTDEMAQTYPKLKKSHTAILDSIGEALDLLSPVRPADAIYVITDDGENASRSRGSDIERRLISTGVRLFGFMLDDTSLAPRDFDGFDSYGTAAELIQSSGGAKMVLRPNTPTRWGASFDFSAEGQNVIRILAGLLYQLIEKVYLIELELPQEVDRPRPWKLEIAPNRNGQFKALSLHYPQKLFPCSTAKKDVQQLTPN